MKPRARMLGPCVAAIAMAVVISAAWAADETTTQNPSQPTASQQAQQEPAAVPQQAVPQSQANAVPPPPAPATATPQNVTLPTTPRPQPAASDLILEYGQWLWDPRAGVWFWQPIVPPPVYYVTPYPYGYPYWWHGGLWTFTPNPDYRNTVGGMLLLPQQQLPGQFRPGQSPTFPWNQPRTGSGFAPGVGAQAPWLPREPKEQPSK